MLSNIYSDSHTHTVLCNLVNHECEVTNLPWELKSLITDHPLFNLLLTRSSDFLLFPARQGSALLCAWLTEELLH